MGKAIWTVLSVILLAAAVAGAYWFVKETFLNSNKQVPGLVETISNPASVFCGTLQGKVEVRRSFMSETRVCVLPDGQECEENALYERNECVQP